MTCRAFALPVSKLHAKAQQGWFCFLYSLLLASLGMDRLLDIARDALSVPRQRNVVAMGRLRERRSMLCAARNSEQQLATVRQQAAQFNRDFAVRQDDCMLVGQRRAAVTGSSGWRKWTTEMYLRVSFERLQVFL